MTLGAGENRVSGGAGWPAGLKWNSRARERGVAGCRHGRHVHVMRFHPVAAVLIVATFDVGCADTQRPLAPSLAATPSFSMGGAAACPTPANVVVTDEAGLKAPPPAASPRAGIGLGACLRVMCAVLGTPSDIHTT